MFRRRRYILASTLFVVLGCANSEVMRASAVTDSGTARGDGGATEPRPTPEEDGGGSPADGGSSIDPPPPPPPPPAMSGDGIWVDRARLAELPASGAAWDALVAVADAPLGTPNVSDQDSTHDTHTLAAALACARLGDSSYCTKARGGLLAAIDTEDGGRWLAVGRNVTAYVIAADVLDLRADGDASSDGSRIQAWLARFLTRTLASNNDASLEVQLSPFGSGSNASAQEGAVYAAIAAYLGDRDALDRAWDAFRTYACDPTAPDRETINVSNGVEYGWAHDDAHPCAVDPAGTTKAIPSGRAGAGTTRRIDGAIINDMRRGGYYAWPPGYTQYPWVGLEGFVPAALILHRAGYAAFEVADRAVLRALDYLWYLRTESGDDAWFDGTRASEIVHIVDVVYGRDWPTRTGIGGGRTVGFTDWTHPDGI